MRTEHHADGWWIVDCPEYQVDGGTFTSCGPYETTGQLLATVTSTVPFSTDFTSVESRLDSYVHARRSALHGRAVGGGGEVVAGRW